MNTRKTTHKTIKKAYNMCVYVLLFYVFYRGDGVGRGCRWFWGVESESEDMGVGGGGGYN